MSVDLRSRHDRLFREQAVSMFGKGYGYALTAGRFGVCTKIVGEWQETCRAIGRNGLLAMGVKYVRYDYETKVTAARTVVDDRMSKFEATIRFGVASMTPLKQWCRLYREDDMQVLEPRPKGRPKGLMGAVPSTHEEKFQERVRKLGAQVVCLKKSIVLKA